MSNRVIAALCCVLCVAGIVGAVLAGFGDVEIGKLDEGGTATLLIGVAAISGTFAAAFGVAPASGSLPVSAKPPEKVSVMTRRLETDLETCDETIDGALERGSFWSHTKNLPLARWAEYKDPFSTLQARYDRPVQRAFWSLEGLAQRVAERAATEENAVGEVHTGPTSPSKGATAIF